MKIAFKNFLTTLKRYRMASALNIAGLTLAFTAFYVIMAQVRYETMFNHSIEDSDRIYLIMPQWGGDEWSTNAPRLTSERAMAASPDVESGGIVQLYSLHDRVWAGRSDRELVRYDISVNAVSESLVDVMSFRAVAGELHDISKPDMAIVSREAAELMGVGVGDDIYLPGGEWLEDPRPSRRVTVAGVFENFADNTVMHGLNILVDIGDLEAGSNNNWNFSIYVKLREGADTENFAKIWRDDYNEWRRNMMAEWEALTGESYGDEEPRTVRLVSLRDQYYCGIDVGEFTDEGFRTGTVSSTAVKLSVATVIVIVAFINFVNFFFAMIPVRLRAVNICKVFGASNRSLRSSFVFEAVGLVVLSLVLSLYLMAAVGDSFMAEYIDCSLALSDNVSTLAAILCIAVLMALAAAVYPAWYITSFSPAFVIKGSFQATRSGRVLRYTLVGVQYVISIALIIVTLFIQMQHNYMMNYDMGFDKGGILAVDGPAMYSYQQMDALSEKLRQNPMVTDVTYGAGDIVAPQRMGWGRDFRDKTISFQCYPVAWNFLDFMGIKVVEGRDFTKDDYRRANGVFIFNESAKRSFELTLDDKLEGHAAYTDIAGFCDDFHFKPLQYGVEPFCFYVFGASPWYYPSHVYVRIAAGTGIREAIRYVRETVMAFDPSLEADKVYIRIFDEELGKYYNAEERLARLIAAFSLLSIVISMLGVFGLVLFETQYRRKEIGIRRVNGASVGSVLNMFNMQFLRIVGVCTVIALPISYYIVDRWLEGFATRMPIRWWVFALAVVIVALITVATVTVRSWRAANENPVDAIEH